MSLPDLSHPAIPGAEIAIRATPRASADRLVVEAGAIRAYVTAVPEEGKANRALQLLLAKALGVAKLRLTLIRGQTARDKVFRLD